MLCELVPPVRGLLTVLVSMGYLIAGDTSTEEDYVREGAQILDEDVRSLLWNVLGRLPTDYCIYSWEAIKVQGCVP